MVSVVEPLKKWVVPPRWRYDKGKVKVFGDGPAEVKDPLWLRIVATSKLVFGRKGGQWWGIGRGDNEIVEKKCSYIEGSLFLRGGHRGKSGIAVQSRRSTEDAEEWQSGEAGRGFETIGKQREYAMELVVAQAREEVAEAGCVGNEETTIETTVADRRQRR
jgi:hypothetical protein